MRITTWLAKHCRVGRSGINDVTMVPRPSGEWRISSSRIYDEHVRLEDVIGTRSC